MRRAVLLRSVGRILGGDAAIHDAAYMWTRHRWMIPYASTVFAAIALLAPIVGIEDWPTRIVIGLAGASVAVMATTEYRVLAQTADDFVLLDASRIRQVATAPRDTLDADDVLEPVGGTMLAADWQVAEHRYTVPRSSEQAMQRMYANRSAAS